MSELHELCKFPQRPINPSYIKQLKYFLQNGIPATYTVEEATAYTLEQEAQLQGNTKYVPEQVPEDQNTTPLHIIARHIPEDATTDELETVYGMVDELFNWGAGWNLTDYENKTPGDLLFEKGLRDSKVYQRVVDAGVSAEILLRKINDGDFEFLSDDEEAKYAEFEQGEQGQAAAEEGSGAGALSPEHGNEHEDENNEKENVTEALLESKSKDTDFDKIAQQLINDPANTQSTYLNTELEYKNGALITKENQDGVMMDWESDLMKAGRDTIFKSVDELISAGQKSDDEVDNIEDINEINILNIGFGMGIIDTLIQEREPTNHYISEAHPDVLKKLEDDGWLKKKNVTVLKGRWQDTLPELLNKGVFFNGIYYDTYSEHYSDMLDLFDLIVGLLKPSGIFSFFNGLGADRQIVYDVYKKIVEIDLNNYGMNVSYQELATPPLTDEKFDNLDESIWTGIKRAYWRCKTYNHPEIRFA
jgi:protein arginine N-methyltransferase 2